MSSGETDAGVARKGDGMLRKKQCWNSKDLRNGRLQISRPACRLNDASAGLREAKMM
jgi:hypothetical protein